MALVKLVCPTRQGRYLPSIETDVAWGEPVEVPDELAGRPPRPSTGVPGEKGYDPGDLGEGLLAQIEVWEAVKAAEKGAKS